MRKILLVFCFSLYFQFAFSQNWKVLDTSDIGVDFFAPKHIEVDLSNNSIWFGDNSQIIQIIDGELINNVFYDDFIPGMDDVNDFVVSNDVVYVIDESEGLIEIVSGVPTVVIPEMKAGYTLTLDDQDTLWVGSSSSYGVGYYGYKGGFYNSYTIANSGIQTNIVFNVFEDNYERKWFTYQPTGGTGITLQDDTLWQFYSTGNSNLTTNKIRFVTQDRDGVIWAATKNGLFRYNEVLEDWEGFTKQNSNMPGEWVLDLEFDFDGRMWAIFKDTALAYTYNYTNWTVYDETNSPIKDVNSLEELAIDSLGNIWMTGLHEIYCFNESGIQGWANTSNNSKINEINVYPNPANSVVYINTYCQNGSINIFDLLGNLIYHRPNCSQLEIVDVSDFDNGIYLVQFEHLGEVLTSKFVVNK